MMMIFSGSYFTRKYTELRHYDFDLPLKVISTVFHIYVCIETGDEDDDDGPAWTRREEEKRRPPV